MRSKIYFPEQTSETFEEVYTFRDKNVCSEYYLKTEPSFSYVRPWAQINAEVR